MDGIIAVLYALAVFVGTCCCCSLWQAWRSATNDIDFDELHSKYSKENISRVKDKRKKTAKEILLLKEEIKIAEERLLAEARYEEKLRKKYNENNDNTLVHRKRKKRRLRNKPDYDSSECLDDSDSDIESLLRNHENNETDIERGKQYKNQLQRKYNIRHKRQTEDNLIEKVYTWFHNGPEKAKYSDESDEEPPSNVEYIKQIPNKIKKKLSFELPQLDWQLFKSTKVDTSRNQYAPESHASDADISEASIYDPKCITSKEVSLESSPVPERSIMVARRKPDIKLEVRSPSHTRTRIHSNYHSNKIQAWGSPISQASTSSIGLPFQSPITQLKPLKQLDKTLKLSPLKLPLAHIPKLKSSYLEQSSPEFLAESTEILDEDGGLLYQSESVEIFKPSHEINDDYSDL